MIKENTNIGIVVSLGQKIVNVPKVVGMEEDKAKEALKKEDLEVVVVEEFNKKVEAGFVISQDIEENKEIPAGQAVTITVSKGIEEVAVPNVVGKTQEDAVKELTEAGFTITATLTEQDLAKEDGTILKQSLDAGSTVEKGANITITVNQIQQLVNGTVAINLKSVMNFGGHSGNDTNYIGTSYARNVMVKLVANDDTVYNETHREDESNIRVRFSGVGTVTLKLYVDEILKGQKQVNLSREQSVTFE
ncbi:MAG: PASTA domain-containing protein [Clostridia bacterium]|nr:PASTA domain-containing protein [Clostridia bacterium]